MDQTIDFDAVRKGLAGGEFFLEYQPIVSLADGRCIGGEALARWRRPTGVVPPADFIPIVEGTPLSGLMTYWVIDTVAAEMGDWLRANPEACISMNVPPEILGRGGLEYAATKSGLREVADQIILEITERGIPDLLGVQGLNLMPRSGVRVALDDVTLMGGGHLAVLARCNFSIIKIDISLIAQIGPQSPRPEWLGGLSAFLESTQMTVIAEGVETQQQFETLRDARVQWAQGFYFSPAIPAPDFIAYHRVAAR